MTRATFPAKSLSLIAASLRPDHARATGTSSHAAYHRRPAFICRRCKVSRRQQQARKGRFVLIGLDEHPLHQITNSFAGVAGSDSAVERRPLRVPLRRRRQRVPDVQRAAVPEQRRPRRLRVPPPRRPAAQHPAVPAAAAAHGPLRRRAAAHRARRADADAALRARGQRVRHRLRRAVPQHGAARTRIRSRSPASTAGCSASGPPTSSSACARAGSRWPGSATS